MGRSSEHGSRDPAPDAPPPDPHAAPAAAVLVQYAHERASAWFPELPGPTIGVILEREVHRPRSRMFVLRLSAGSESRRVLAKAVRPAFGGRRSAEQDKPRIASPADPEALAGLQYRGLEVAHRHMAALGDPRFGAVRPLDFLERHGTIIMEYVAHPTLGDRLSRASRFVPGASAEGLPEVFANAGAWLREYHAIAGARVLQVRYQTRDELISAAVDLTEFLAAGSQQPAAMHALRVDIQRIAMEHLPQHLPLGLSHGDYAPRNIFVGPGSRVTPFDALPRWRAPVFEDLARMLVAVRTGRLQTLSIGTAHGERDLERYEASLLAGYFGASAVPAGAIRVFEMFAILNRWGAILAHRRSTRFRARLEMRARLVMSGHRFARELRRLTALLDDGAA